MAKDWRRGAIALGIIGALTAGALISPVGAAFTPTKKKIKKIAAKQVAQKGKQLFYSQGDILALADTDDAGQPTTATSQTDPREVSRITFTAPSAGILLLSGSSFLEATTAAEYQLVPRLDSQEIAVGARQRVAANSAFTLAYTAAIRVSAGAHTLTQELRSPTTVTYNYNGDELTATFIPTGTIT